MYLLKNKYQVLIFKFKYSWYLKNKIFSIPLFILLRVYMKIKKIDQL